MRRTLLGTPTITGRAGRMEAMTASWALAYPADWSVKSPGSELTPHLSTIDMVCLAGLMADAFLSAQWDLSDIERGVSYVSHLSLKASATAVTDLHMVPVVLRAVDFLPNQRGRKSLSTTIFSCDVGTMGLQLTVQHPAADRSTRVDGKAERILVNAANNLYGLGYLQSPAGISGINSDLAAASIRADLLVESRANLVGIESAYRSSASIVDCLVLCSQLAQAHMYQATKTNRSNTSPLWMRRLSINRDLPRHAQPLEAITVELQRLHRMERNGWITANLQVGDFAGIQANASLAFSQNPATQVEAVPARAG